MPKPKSSTASAVPSTEIKPPRSRRQFTAEEKQRILREADACCGTGELGALLRREGLYSSHLSTWRAQEARGALAALDNAKPGRKPKSGQERRVAELERENAQLTKDLRIARKLIELQGKAHEILGIALPRIDEQNGADSSDSLPSATRRSR